MIKGKLYKIIFISLCYVHAMCKTNNEEIIKVIKY